MYEYEELTDIIGCSCTLLIPYRGRTEGFVVADYGEAILPTQEAQKRSMTELLESLCLDYPDADIIGHRDLPWVKKNCPCFDIKLWLSQIKFHI